MAVVTGDALTEVVVVVVTGLEPLESVAAVVGGVAPVMVFGPGDCGLAFGVGDGLGVALDGGGVWPLGGGIDCDTGGDGPLGPGGGPPCCGYPGYGCEVGG